MSDPALYTAEHGGGTFDGDTLEPAPLTEGYAVALCDGDSFPYSQRPMGPAGLAELERMIYAVRDTFRPPYVGTWWDRNVVHVDSVVVLPDLDSAMILGRALHQKAIYDFAAGKDIQL